jgi:hypothetical protein
MLVDRLIPLKDFVAQHHHMKTEGTLRRWIRTNYKDFSRCAVKVGEKYYIDPNVVEQWIEEQRVSQQGKK